MKSAIFDCFLYCISKLIASEPEVNLRARFNSSKHKVYLYLFNLVSKFARQNLKNALIFYKSLFVMSRRAKKSDFVKKFCQRKEWADELPKCQSFQDFSYLFFSDWVPRRTVWRVNLKCRQMAATVRGRRTFPLSSWSASTWTPVSFSIILTYFFQFPFFVFLFRPTVRKILF